MKHSGQYDIYVAGISGNRISADIVDLVAASPAAVVCSAAHLSLLRQTVAQLPETIAIAPVGECLTQMERAATRGFLLVLTSGDPLFFGLGRLIGERFSTARIRFLPAVSSMQLCFARFGIPWDDAFQLSLHGRPLALLNRHLHHNKLFILTDAGNSPQVIARHLLNIMDSEEISRLFMYVGERLDMQDEQIFTGSPEDIGRRSFREPNCLIIRRTPAASAAGRFGLLESEIRHSRGLITKNEVRAAVLHRLALPEQGVLWDIGAGSGSISIEAARLNAALEVYAVEQKAAQQGNIAYNRVQFRCWNLTLVAASAPAALASLPPPDRVFIGGSGGSLDEIIRQAVKRLTAGGILVLTGVLEETCRRAPQLLHELGCQVEVSIVATTRSSYPDGQQEVLNPIHIIRATTRI